MEQIIPRIDRGLLKKELTADKLLRKTNKSGNEIYLFTAHSAPNLMQEVGRLREIAFRYYGGGSGKSADIDEFDVMENPYRQLIVWDPEEEEILGGYRFICGNEVIFNAEGQPSNLATSELFHFSERFIRKYLPRTVELGRSFVSLDYQSTKTGSKGLYALDNLWDGLGALTVIDPRLQFFFGKVTMYSTYNREARNMILYFLDKYFRDRRKLIRPILPLKIEDPNLQLKRLFKGWTYKEDYKILNTEVRKFGINIPPLVSAYIRLSPSMKVFGTAVNTHFGDVEETGILINFHEIFEEKRQRHIESFLKDEPSRNWLNRIRAIISSNFPKVTRKRRKKKHTNH
ncbi:MAG: GNAT family N-acetyltransferase [Dysgonamonadaceae bacterium]|jgi:hypothetical protein|nr:GNAT family N-acetyltransferase [Dysgonamonadaceae bacterium]